MEFYPQIINKYQGIKGFVSLCNYSLAFKIKAIQTDNGLEFEKYFRDYLEKKGILHFWLLFYNTQRPYFSLGNIPPLKYLMENFRFSNMLWTYTNSVDVHTHRVHFLGFENL